ncbi:MAG: hypothetical protein AAFW46_00735 [Pseudomonadota bacterium]
MSNTLTRLQRIAAKLSARALLIGAVGFATASAVVASLSPEVRADAFAERVPSAETRPEAEADRTWSNLGEALDALTAQAAPSDTTPAPIDPGAAPQLLWLETAPQAAKVRILFLPKDEAAVERPNRPETERLTVTGAYSSGDRFGPEGFVLRHGVALNPRPQGWDGLLLVGAQGGASLHDVSRVEIEDERYDLRDPESRQDFLNRAAREDFSAIQSHLLINEGALDLKPYDGAPSFRRRLLFETVDGRLGLFDTSPTPTTLYEAAAELQARIPTTRMALNLDMGTYDFCVWRRPGERKLCGLLTAPNKQKLTNLIEFELPTPGDDGAQ